MKLLPALAWILGVSLSAIAPRGASAAEPPPETAPSEASEPTPAPSEAPPVDPALQARRDSARAYVRRGQELASTRRLDEALAAFRKALEVYPAYPLASYELGITLVEMGDLPGAEANLLHALGLAPDFARAHQALGEVRRRLRRLDDAQGSFRRALELAPRDLSAWYGLASVLRQKQQDPETLWALESLLAAADNPDAPIAAEARREAALLIQRGVVAKALDEVVPEDTAADAPAPQGNNAEALTKKGDVAFRERRYLAALEAYHAAWDVLVPPAPEADAKPEPKADAKPEPKADAKPEPKADAKPTEPKADAKPAEPGPRGDAALAYKLGATYAVMNDTRQAMRWWKTAISLAPSRELFARHLALLVGKTRQAEATAPASDANPAATDPVERAKAALRRGDPGAALLIVRGLDAPLAAHLEGEARLRLGDPTTARSIFEELLGADPEDRLAKAGLAEALLHLGLTDPAGKAIESWMGGGRSRPETFLVLRRDELDARLLAPAEPED